MDKIKTFLKKKRLDLLVVFRPANLFYLCGFRGTDGALVIWPNKAVLVVDTRYEERAELEAANVEILGGRSVAAALKDALMEAAPAKAGFEAGGLTYAEYESLFKSLDNASKKIELVPVHNAVEGLRVIKDDDEVADLQLAAGLADRTISYLTGEIRPGRTEKELAKLACGYLRDNGAEGESFEIIVASGPNSSMPHASSTDRILERGDLVLVDLGAIVNGYHSDISRTFVIGKPTLAQAAMHAAAAHAGRLVLEAIKPGLPAAEADEMCRSYLDNYGGPARLLHGLGHGVGLEIHEQPQLGTGSTDELKNGMVFTIEPGLYARGFGGVRVEDMVVLNGEPRLMTQSPRDLIGL
ncbi:MAG: Xaa-Pro peptidase family protein [Actinomycetota bacterium]